LLFSAGILGVYGIFSDCKDGAGNGRQVFSFFDGPGFFVGISYLYRIFLGSFVLLIPDLIVYS
jgi:hypothetical protein